jgi:hypothetical protein
VNRNLKDKDGHQVIDLAGAEKIASIGRYKRSQYSGHVEKPYLDNRCRETIVRLLWEDDRVSRIKNCAEDDDLRSSTPSPDSQRVLEQRVKTLQAELAQIRKDGGLLQHELNTSRDELRVASTDLQEAKAQKVNTEQQYM